MTHAVRIIAALAALGLASTQTAWGQSTADQEAKTRAANIAAHPEAARSLFGQKTTPASTLAPRAIGSYARGCLAGGQALPTDGPSWQVMRLNRNRNWGHPVLIDYLERLVRDVPRITGWNGLLIGDMSQPRGGPMLTGHASHQIGLDADIWLTPMPRGGLSREQRENMPAVNMARSDWRDVDPRHWTPSHIRLLKAVSADPKVERIFVNPAIKVALCREPGDRSWLEKVRPIWGHNYHFHIRLACPAGMASCQGQEPPNFGDGCGAELTGWVERQHDAIFNPPKPKPGLKPKPKPPMGLDALPPECRQVLAAP